MLCLTHGVDKCMPHGAYSRNDSNKKPMGQTCQPHGYVCTLVTYDILSTPWVILSLSGPWNELVCHPRGCHLLSPHGVFSCCELEAATSRLGLGSKGLVHIAATGSWEGKGRGRRQLLIVNFWLSEKWRKILGQAPPYLGRICRQN